MLCEKKDKILSLSDPDIHVVAREKAHAEVEFGNTLFLAEQTKGLIVDWYLYQEQTPADHAMIPEHLQRMENEHPITVEAITGDRGLDSVRTAVLLGNTIVNYVCPHQRMVFERCLQDDSSRRHSRRCAQTETRIAIVTHGFVGNPMRKWGYHNKERLCAWGYFAQNLWMLARLPKQIAQRKAAE